LFIVNMGHATTAYIGFLLGQSTIQEALKKEIIEQFLRGTLLEASQYFIKKLNIDPKVMKDYLAKTIKRFKNENINDDIYRVGKDPIRKLGFHERLVEPMRKLYEMDCSVKHLSLAIAAAFLFNNPEDESSMTIQKYIKEYGIAEAIK